MSSNSHPLTWILKIVTLWRICLLLVASYAIKAIPFKDSFPYWQHLLVPNGHPIFWGWGNFDGVHYLTIAKEGYSAQFTQAFFPVFPLVIRFSENLIGNYLYSGLIINHIFFIIFLYLMYALIRLDSGRKKAKYVLLYIILFPTSFYFVSLYSESLFLMLAAASFLAARKKHWWLAGIFGAIASATRIFGIFLLPALLVEWYYSRGSKNVYSLSELFKAVLPILTIGGGLAAYMFYLKTTFSDPLLFLNSQPAFGAERSADKVVMLYQVFWRYAKMITTVDPHTLLYYTVSLEALTGGIFFILSLLAFRYTRLSYALFGLLSYITPTLTGTFSSMPRYVLMLFPSFLVLALVKNERFHRIWWFVSSILLVINVALYIRGYWIA